MDPIDKGKRPMDPYKDPCKKNNNYVPVQNGLYLQPPTPQRPAHSQLLTQPILDKGKRPMDSFKEPSNQNKHIFVAPQDRLNLQPPLGFQRPSDSVPLSHLPPSGSHVQITNRMLGQRARRERERSTKLIGNSNFTIQGAQVVTRHVIDHQLMGSTLNGSPSLPQTPLQTLLPPSGSHITNRILGQRARRERERSTKLIGSTNFTIQGAQGSTLNGSHSLPQTPLQADKHQTHNSPVTPHATPYRRLSSSESLRKSLSFLNPVRLFTLPEERVTSSTHADSSDQNNTTCISSASSSLPHAIPHSTNENFVPTPSHQNASTRNCRSSTSSFVHPISHLTNAASASSSTNRNSRQQPFGDPAQYCEEVHNNGFDRPISANNADISDDEDEVDNIVSNHLIEQGRHSLGRMDVQCPFCSALHWMDERLKDSSLSRPRFGTCCLQGKVKLPPLRPLPPALKALYDGNDRKSKSFRKYMRQYNQAFAFTSLGGNERVFTGRGPRPFTIHGQLRHRTGSLIPDTGRQPTYSQLYIYDPSAALDIRQLRNPHLNTDVLKIIHATMLQYNCFSATFRHAYDVLRSASLQHGENFNVPAYLHYSATRDRRRYNLPTADEIAVILPGDGSERNNMRDIVIYLKGGQEFMQISECHPAYLPLHYVLMFPYGELGWSPDMRRSNTNDRLTQMDFYSYRIFERPGEYSAILRGHKLFQEFLVDGWAVTEQNKMRYYRLQQDKLRAELYQGITDVAAEAFDPNQIGRRVVLPASCVGSPRHMFEIFQDSMAITRYNKHPDIFLTMTANPHWDEVVEALSEHQTVTHRPEVVARVFELKRRALMKEIKKKGVLGTAVAHVYTIEFQKRGLPHMHALIYLRHSDKIRIPAQVDRIVCAEFPDPETEPELFQTVLTCMVHGPCGLNNPNSPCMVNGRCKHHYPRTFADATTMDKDGYPIYRRRDNGRSYIVRGHTVDNRDVVPYNPYLSKMFNCHINVEVCAGIRCVKYIHKYIFKGHDMTTIVLNELDEIQQYLDARYIGPPEAVWRLLSFHLHEEIPTVVRLALHLPGMHRVVYKADEPIHDILSRAEHQKSTLTAFFDCCASDSRARSLTYQEFPEYYVWNKQSQTWTRRIREGKFAIGRMYFASPNSGERFYLRLLLTVVKGPQSFDDLKRIGNGPPLPTFKDACVARGLLEDDSEWVQCLQEASVMQTGYHLRRLFCVILAECNPLQPQTLWNDFWENICDDLPHKLRTMFNIPEPTPAEVQDYGLFLLNEILIESGKSLANFPLMPLPLLTTRWNLVVANRLIWDQRQFQFDPQNAKAHGNRVLLNAEQRFSYQTVIDSVSQNLGKLFFLNGAAGTGKTFVYNTIAATCRAEGHIVIMVASSGIASLLLAGGRTAHSTFRIPLDILDTSVCGFSKNSMHAELFREAKLIIWDEVPMQNKFCVEAVDRTLRDTRDNNKPFGGITVVLGGDFRQCLPVIPKGVREQIVRASLRSSFLWSHIHVLTLAQNMRLENGNSANIAFANFLMEIGSDPSETVELPSTIHRCANLQDLISTTYPQLNQPTTVTPEYLTERTILSARNDDVNDINAAALNMFPGESTLFLAADKMADEDATNPANINQYPNEYLNSLDPAGLPPFRLNLKVGCPIMLLRNIAPKDGLCNGTRLMVVHCRPHVLFARILTGEKAGNHAFIPRISLSPSSSDFPFHMTRRQFPVRVAYAMTINKSQGQSVKYVGIDLRTEVFSHGQLYVALSRCTSSDRISILLPPNSESHTPNFVYPEVLL